MSDPTRPGRKLAAAFFLIVALPCACMVLLGVQLVEADRDAEERRHDTQVRRQAEACATHLRLGLINLFSAGAEWLATRRDPSHSLGDLEEEGAAAVTARDELEWFVLFNTQQEILGPEMGLPFSASLPAPGEESLLTPFPRGENESAEQARQRYLAYLALLNRFRRTLSAEEAGTPLEAVGTELSAVLEEVQDEGLRSRVLYHLARVRAKQSKTDEAMNLCNRLVAEDPAVREEDGTPVRALVFLLRATLWEQRADPERGLIDLFWLWDDLLNGRRLPVDKKAYRALGERILSAVNRMLADHPDAQGAWTERIRIRRERQENALRQDEALEVFRTEVLPRLDTTPLPDASAGFRFRSVIQGDRLYMFMVAPPLQEPGWEGEAPGVAFHVDDDWLRTVTLPALLREFGTPGFWFEVADHSGDVFGPAPVPRALADDVVTLPIDSALLSWNLRAAAEEEVLPFWRSRSLVYLSIIAAALLAVVVSAVFIFRIYTRERRLLKLRSDFVSNVTHELRTPLTSITMFADTLRLGRAHDPAKLREYYDIIYSESLRLARLIENVLDFSSVEAGRRRYELTPMDGREILDRVLESMALPLRNNRFEVHREVPDEALRFRADESAVERVLLNLVSNAMKFSPQAGEITVRMMRRDGMIVYEVEDQGLGIPVEEQGKIFEKFYRIEREGFEKIAGTGLGLSLSRSIVDHHGGRIELDSEPGRGSLFRVLFPEEPPGGRTDLP